MGTTGSGSMRGGGHRPGVGAALRRRWLAVGVGVVAAALAGAWVATTLRARDPLHGTRPQTGGRVAVAGIERELRIDRDRLGIPHVDAQSERDAFFALGFVHAQDRLGQLLHLRRRARGTEASVAGPEALDGDRVARLIDFRGLAERQWGALPRATRRVLEAYATGVNARLARLAEDATPAVADAPEPWQPQDSLAVFKLFAFGLSSSIEASLVLNELVVALGPAEASRFFPPPAPGRDTERRATAAAPAWLGVGARELRRAGGLAGHGVGSTAFAVGGDHSQSGKPMLFADSHFEPTTPAALYLAHLRAPDLDVAGATLPGVPLFWWGRNGALAWAAVNAGVVVTDLYTETVRGDGSEYHDGRRWRPLKERVEHVVVRGGKDATLAIRETTRGPLLPEVDGSEAVSVAWTGARIAGASGIGSLLDVARARDGDAVRAALRRHHEPAIALVWIEASGRAGLQLAGWIPRRTLSSQLLPLPGRARWYAWDDPIPFSSLPAEAIDGGRGFLIAADQSFQGESADEAIDSIWRTGTRRARLAARLADVLRGGADLRSLAALGTDVGLDRSRGIVERALALAGERPRAQEAVELAALLRDWDGFATPDSIGATAYHAYLDVLAHAFFAERMGAERFARFLALPALDLEALVLGVLRDAAGGGGDAWSEPEAVREAVVASLRETWLALSFRHGPDPKRWAWGGVHALRFRAQGGSRGPGPFPYGGAAHAVLAAPYPLAEASQGRFDVSVAATARFAIDADSLDLALVALAPGQSEQPGRPHTDDGLSDWLAGRFALLATRRIEVEDRSVAQLVLEPVR